MLCSLLILFIVGCEGKEDKKDVQTETPKEEVKYEYSMPNKDEHYKTVKEMENDSDVVIIGTKFYSDYNFKNENPSINMNFYSFSFVNIDKVIKNKKENPLEVNKSIGVLETATFDSKKNTVYSLGGYQLMKENQPYLLFLKSSNISIDYVVTGIYYGKIPLTTKDNEVASFANTTALQTLFTEARDTYKKEAESIRTTK